AALLIALHHSFPTRRSSDLALWDLYAKQRSTPLSVMLGGTRPMIASGVVVATDSTANALNQIEQYLEEGYQRIKVKINPNQDYRSEEHTSELQSLRHLVCRL